MGYSETTARSSELAKLLNAYLLYQKIEQRSPRTIRDYRDELAAFISLLSGREHSLKAEDVSPTDVLAYLGHLQDKGRAPATVNRAFGNIRAFFNWLATQEFIEKTPTSKLKAPKEPKRIKPGLDDTHVDLLLSLCPPSTLLGSRRRAMYILRSHHRNAPRGAFGSFPGRLGLGEVKDQGLRQRGQGAIPAFPT